MPDESSPPRRAASEPTEPPCTFPATGPDWIFALAANWRAAEPEARRRATAHFRTARDEGRPTVCLGELEAGLARLGLDRTRSLGLLSMTHLALGGGEPGRTCRVIAARVWAAAEALAVQTEVEQQTDHDDPPRHDGSRR